MGLSIIPVGGYDEVGRNCTAVEVDGDLFLLDLGLHMEEYVRITEDEHPRFVPKDEELIAEGAAPDLSVIDERRVRAVVVSHAHLDHVGAVSFFAHRFSCRFHMTPFTGAVASRLADDKRLPLGDRLVTHGFDEKIPLSEDVYLEFVEVSHSTPQTAAVALHTPYGVVLYLNDFKLDDRPTLGASTDLDRLASLKPKVLIMDCLYGDKDVRTPGEREAKRLLEEALLDKDLDGKVVIASSFSSHVARLQELASLARRLGRKPVFIGRSMAKYLEAAAEVGVSSLIEDHEVVKYSSKARKALAKIGDPSEHFFVVTGGMGEPGAVLSRIVDEKLLPVRRGDVIVFSNRTIPVPVIEHDREVLEKKLSSRGLELLKDLHVSGHAAGKDHVEVLERVRPETLIPVHGLPKQRLACKASAVRAGLREGQVLLPGNGEQVFL
ncbi:MBL fold metallo-hydrolase [Candidatus Woesearchaeota archaeon]|nr:MBL fold metallo-hydrolase [Candidatus Woesearchaeota archaeon]